MLCHRALAVIALATFLAASALAQEARSPDFQLSELEQLRLANAQKDIIIAQLQAQVAQLQAALQEQAGFTALEREVERIREAKGWKPEEVLFDLKTLRFSAAPPKVE